MDIEIIAVGGYDEVGRNMTAVRCGKEIVIFDMGLRLDQVMIHEDAEIENMHSLDLIQMKAIPDDTMMNTVEGTVKAIVCTHGHLDHIGAIPKLAHRYNAPIIATPYTTELIRQQIAGEQKFGVNNKLFALKAGQKYHTLAEPDPRVRPDAALHHRDGDARAPHPPGGDRLCTDFKLDRTPVIGEPPDFARLRQIGKEGVLALIAESTNIGRKGQVPERADRPRPCAGHHDELRGRQERDHRLHLLLAHRAGQDDRRMRPRDRQETRPPRPVHGEVRGHRRADETRRVPRDHQRVREPADRRPDHAPDDEDGQGEVRAHRHRPPGGARLDPHPDCARRHPLPDRRRATRSSSRPRSSRTP